MQTKSRTALDSWFLTGPTAVGKSRVGLELAKRLDAEILSLDSMAIYRGMDIGTAKPSQKDRESIPHHMIDILDPDEEYSVATYCETAYRLIAEIEARGKQVLFVGGTPLYLKSLLRGLCEVPEADWEFRKEVEAELAQFGPEALHARVKQVDPLAASQLHPNDTRRLIRALEVYKITGEPISHRQLEFEEGTPATACKVFTLHRERSELHQRIDSRVEQMFAQGFVDEVNTLTSGSKQLGRTASQAVGYCEVIEHLTHGLPLSEAIEKTKARTRRFAKRQETWYRSLCECRFVPLVEGNEPATIVEQILEAAHRT